MGKPNLSKLMNDWDIVLIWISHIKEKSDCMF